MPSRIAPGDLIEVDERHYKFGRGTLRLRVDAIVRRFPVDGWLELRGVQVLWEGPDNRQRYAAVDPAHVRFVRRARRAT